MLALVKRKKTPEKFFLPPFNYKPPPYNTRVWGANKFIHNFPTLFATSLSLHSLPSLVWSITPKKFLGISLGLSIFFVCSLTSIPIIAQWGIDHAIIPHTISLVFILIAAIILIACVSAISLTTYIRYSRLRRMEASYLIISAICEQAMRLGRTTLTTTSAGEIISIGSADVKNLTNISMMYTRVFQLILGSCYSLFLLAHVRWLYAGVQILGNLLIIIAVTPVLRVLYYKEHNYRILEAEQTGRSGDIVSGLRILTGIGGREVFERSFSASVQRTRKVGLNIELLWLIIALIILVFSSTTVAIIIYLSYQSLAAHHSTIGQYHQAVAQSLLYSGWIWTYVEIFLTLVNGKVSAERIQHFLQLTPQLPEHPCPVDGPSGSASLIDHHTQIRLSPGTFTVIVAHDLATSIAFVHRLARYVPDCEEITWGDKPLAHIRLAHIRERIICSDNDDYLFPGSLLSNLTMGRDFSHSKIHEALHASACDELLEILGNGLDSIVEEKALNLSGGQRQRVRLARALLFNPEILILIDPTSAVDAHVEKIIAHRIKHYRERTQDHTTIVVSHSPHIIAVADTVIVLDDSGHPILTESSQNFAAHPHYHNFIHRISDPSGGR